MYRYRYRSVWVLLSKNSSSVQHTYGLTRRMHESRIVVNMLSLSRFCILFVDLPKYLSSSRPLKLEQSPAVFEIRLSM